MKNGDQDYKNLSPSEMQLIFLKLCTIGNLMTPSIAKFGLWPQWPPMLCSNNGPIDGLVFLYVSEFKAKYQKYIIYRKVT